MKNYVNFYSVATEKIVTIGTKKLICNPYCDLSHDANTRPDVNGRFSEIVLIQWNKWMATDIQLDESANIYK